MRCRPMHLLVAAVTLAAEVLGFAAESENNPRTVSLRWKIRQGQVLKFRGRDTQ